MKMTERQKRRAAQIRWMLAHRELWQDLDAEGLYMRNRGTWRAIANGLKDAGLIARSTGTIDVPVGRLIAGARASEQD